MDITEGAALRPRARHELVLGVEQIDGAIAAAQRAGMVDDQSKQTVELQLRRQFPLDHRERLSLHNQPSVPGFHLRDDGQRQDVHQEGQHTRRERDEGEEGRGGADLEHVAGAERAQADHDGDEKDHEPQPPTQLQTEWGFWVLGHGEPGYERSEAGATQPRNGWSTMVGD